MHILIPTWWGLIDKCLKVVVQTLWKIQVRDGFFLCMNVDWPDNIQTNGPYFHLSMMGSPGSVLVTELSTALLLGGKTLLIHYKNVRAVQHLSSQPKAQVVIIKVCHVSQQYFLLAKSDTAWWFETIPNCLAQLRVSTEHGIDIPQTHDRFVTGHLGAVARNRTYISLFQIEAI